ncbi:hypothetical protein A4A49_57270, partial [Nicotiana attenuata]
MQNQEDFLCLPQVNRPIAEANNLEEYDQATEMHAVIVSFDQTDEPAPENLADQPAAGEREEQIPKQLEGELVSTVPGSLTEESTIYAEENLIVPNLQGISTSDGPSAADIRQSTRAKQPPIRMQDYVTMNPKSSQC